MPNPTLAESLREHLGLHGPCTDRELHAALVLAGRTTTRTSAGVLTVLRRSPLTRLRPDGRWDLVTRRLAGAVLTVRPRALVRDDTLWIHGDLEPFTTLGGRLPLTTGGEARGGGSEIRTLVGPPGWLPKAALGDLLALRWDGSAMSVTVLAQAPDPERVRRVQELLRLHALAVPSPSYGGPTRMTSAVLSALDEDPDLLAEPILPLGELLPFGEDLSPDTGVWENHHAGRRLTVHLPDRVYGELQRRSELLGDQLPDYVGMLLGAAADRLTPRTADCYCGSAGDRFTTPWQVYPGRYEPERYERDRYQSEPYEPERYERQPYEPHSYEPHSYEAEPYEPRAEEPPYEERFADVVPFR